ncbi:hypothetical protein Sjap_021211 [Stephania japonica]|uniref:Uncharacterized protein n=1 Tax=Stephania japonica TaxID=461633 RepID=A0AAP0F4W6_9MAGN
MFKFLIQAAIHKRTTELSQLQPDTPIDETELYLEIVQRNDKGRRFGLGWTPLRSKMRRHDEAGSSRPILKDDEPFDQFNKEFEEMQAMILKMLNDTSLNRDQLLEMQGRLQRMEQGFMERSICTKKNKMMLMMMMLMMMMPLTMTQRPRMMNDDFFFTTSKKEVHVACNHSSLEGLM